MRRPGILLALAALCRAQTQPPPSAEGVAYFEKNIRPLLASNCYTCHSSNLASPMSGFTLDTRVGLLRGGKTGVPAVVPGRPEDSLLIAAVKHTANGLSMPPGKTLNDSQIASLVEWIKMGAPDPRTEAAPGAPPAYDWEKARRHWSFQPVTDPQPPRVSAAWNQSPIDAFIKSKLDEQKLTPQALASKPALIRRVTYDLTGLPPTPEEVAAFVKDASPQAFEKLVDRLLASPQYGEKWGRHWLDLVRYADTAGDNADFPVPSLYRYRNWVIAAFNHDQPYDQFLRDQIAGDLIAARDGLASKNIEEWRSKIIATGYLANSRRFGSRANEFHLTIDDTIDNIGKAMLGLTIACARCHDHKFDPIPTADYYALYGIFKSTNYAHAGTEIYPHTYGFTALNPDDAARLKEVETQLSGLDNRTEDISAGRIKFPTDAAKRQAQQEDDANKRRWTAAYPYLRKAYSVSDGAPVNARIMVRGEPATLGPAVPRGFLTILGGQKLPTDEKGSGRLELAQWIANPNNPLTARVIVNRVWAWHFGQGIVPTPDDFGARGEPPVNPALLDYLTSRFIEDAWSIKKLHRRILLTRAYQMASGANEANLVKDSRNAFLWRFNPRRLDAEEIRDALLCVSANLDLTPGAEQPFPLEMSWHYSQHQPFIGADSAYATNKRSVYLMQQRIRRQHFLELFDGADPNSETGIRPQTTTALQALFDMNDPFFHTQADALAIRLAMNFETDAGRLGYAYQLLYSRAPAADELREARQFLTTARQSLGGSRLPDWQVSRAAWAGLMRVLLSANEFITLD
jgi:hypothetical protein